MNALQKSLFILALFTLTLQCTRHIYVKFVEKRTSVLDAFDKKEVNRQIEAATSLDTLLEQYEKARWRTNELDAEVAGKSELIQAAQRQVHAADYQRVTELRHAILDWERKEAELRQLRYYWFVGLGLLVLGVALYVLRARWLGMGLIIPAFAKMIWWSSPYLSFGGAVHEFDKLLNARLCYSLLTLALLLALWLVNGFLTRRRKAAPLPAEPTP